ncbi:MAG TPA: GNA1162 family protein [Candidatus Limnocylindrales bacterium]|nr:GNA1162 family protein [Candidatus Limnocylindrales bacterium]
MKHAFVIMSVLALVSGCIRPPDYSAFRTHQPKSILVLPPMNQTVAVEAPYSYLSTVSMPLAEAGYYVFPVGVVDAFLKENGLPTPGEMHSVPVQKLGEVFGADSVLYVTITEWGQKYVVLSSNTIVAAEARLLDADTGIQIWQGKVRLVQQSGGSGNLVADLIVAVVEQIIDSSTDQARLLSRPANFALLTHQQTGLPPGPRHPAYASDSRGR